MMIGFFLPQFPQLHASMGYLFNWKSLTGATLTSSGKHIDVLILRIPPFSGLIIN
jgi:hypothetical protein